jgi:alkanesulfonate monooxygenase SsuD/methylene tetrahydromethanopterin reductase-like flavin-dependent oxidoreductase (luciferase family)
MRMDYGQPVRFGVFVTPLANEHGVRFEGSFYQLLGSHSGPGPAHPVRICRGAYKPRMRSIVGRLADGWEVAPKVRKEVESRRARRAD